MKWKVIIGAIAASFLISCSKEEQVVYVPLDGDRDISLINKEIKDPENNILKNFVDPSTKVRVVPIWHNGDLISVYSIGENDEVVFIDTCAVYDVGDVEHHLNENNFAKITAEVAKKCKGYFAAYPYDVFDYAVGSRIAFEADRHMGGTIDISRLHVNGKLGPSSPMTSWCKWCPDDRKGNFDFRERAALIQVNDIDENDLPVRIRIENGIDVTIDEFTDETMYFPITTAPGNQNSIDVYYKTYYHKSIRPNVKYAIGHIYPFDVSSIRLVGLMCEGPAKMRPSESATIRCYAVLGDGITRVDISNRCEWSAEPANAAAISVVDGSVLLKKEAAMAVTITAAFEDYSATLVISHGK